MNDEVIFIPYRRWFDLYEDRVAHHIDSETATNGGSAG